MKDKPMGEIKEKGMQEHLRHIYENAADNDIITVSAEPSTDSLRPKDAPQLYSDNLYFNIEGTLYKVALTEV